MASRSAYGQAEEGHPGGALLMMWIRRSVVVAVVGFLIFMLVLTLVLEAFFA
jgi:hypothetical protein